MQRARVGDRLRAAAGDGVHRDATRLECRAQPAHVHALPALGRVIVVGGEDNVHRWHFGQYTVVRPATTVRVSTAPQRKHASPPRPYTCTPPRAAPRAFHT